MVKEKENSDRILLKIEIYLIVLVSISFFTMLFIGCFIEMKEVYKILIISIGTIIFLTGSFVSIKIEQIAGYYQCKHCNNKYIPTYKAINISMHMGRTRYLKCPNCKKKSWNKKVINK